MSFVIVFPPQTHLFGLTVRLAVFSLSRTVLMCVTWSFQLELYMTTSSMYAIAKSVVSCNMVSISSWKMAGAFFTLNGIQVNSNLPLWQMKQVFGMSISLTGI